MSNEAEVAPMIDEDGGDTNWGLFGNITLVIGAVLFLSGIYVIGKGDAQKECEGDNKWADKNINTGRILVIIGFILLIVGVILKMIG